MGKFNLVSWNIACVRDCWRTLREDPSLDLALLQEAVPPEPGVAAETIPASDASWGTAGWQKKFCAAIGRLSDRITLRPIATKPLDDVSVGPLAVSRPGTLAAAEVDVQGERIVVVSLYSAWETALDSKINYADTSAHRLVSDLSAIVTSNRGRKIIAAGDLNIYFGHGERGSDYWRDRYLSVFSRMEALGVPLVGPQHPNGVQTDPWPEHLPRHSLNVPTFRTRRSDPASATYQLDFVFASTELHERMRVRALNEAHAWGPSDHCRVRIELA